MADSFSRRMSVLSDLVVENAAKYVRAAAIVIDVELTNQTPVDTGRARSNWMVSLDELRTETREPYVLGGYGDTAAANAALAQQEAAARIAQYKLGQTIYIQNNLPYIQRLNEGWSPQAQPGFVDDAVEQGRLYLRGKKLLSRS